MRRRAESWRGQRWCERTDCSSRKDRVSFYGFLHFRQQIAKHKTIAVYNFSRADRNGKVKDRAVKNKSVELAVFAAGVSAGREIGEERIVELASSEAAIEDLGIHANGDGAEALRVEETNELERVALPNRKKCSHADAGQILFAIAAQVFQEDVAKGHLSNAVVVMGTQRFLHARFVSGIDALRRDADFVKRQADGLGLPLKQLAPHAMHADALVSFGHGGQ